MQDAVGEENGRLTTEVGQMKKDMADLQKKDPEFYKLLQENKGIQTLTSNAACRACAHRGCNERLMQVVEGARKLTYE